MLRPLLFCLRDWLLAVPQDYVRNLSSEIRASFDLLDAIANSTVDDKLKKRVNRPLEVVCLVRH